MRFLTYFTFVDVTAQVGVVHREFGLFRDLLIQQW